MKTTVAVGISRILSNAVPQALAGVRLTVSVVLLAVSAASLARAAEIRCYCGTTFRPAFTELFPAFERMSGHKVAAEYANIGALTERLRKGEAADVAIVSAQQNEDLQELGKIVLGSHIDIARVGISLIVRSGAPKPDIRSAEAFKKTLLLAKSIIYGDPAAGGPSGLYLANLIERLGIAAEIKPKTKLSGAGENLFEAVAKGEVELGLENTTSLAQRPGIDIVGPLPPEFQSYTVYSAGILTSSAQQEAARTLITFLVSPSSKSVLKARGFEPL